MQPNGKSITLHLEGRVMGRWVGEVQRVCDRHLARGQHLTLDMGEVRFVDTEGVVLIQNLKEQGVEVANCSRFVAKQLERAGRPE
jgi:ABC-type transporter Mla MlaB component